ncbi:MAG TPA: sigma factor-like helix-turn-helix DNA-binding protein [Actinophytocola sp.]|jgi:RNA polymerase sigma-70 factor (ECF subfamily)|uniref:sigma factor-like helix-turn-helix DNA-binding protein n=1 Tax=Actinophytocola sp. TaxID=1872138 RepID=UPI002F958D94
MTYREALRTNLPAALGGDPRAVERLLAAFRPIVGRYCRARLGGDGGTFLAADEIAQRACLSVLAALPRYPDQSRPFLAFVYDIAAATVDGVAGPRPGHPLDRLPAAQRDVVILRTVVGLSTEETAEAIGMSPAGVRLTQHRALARLRAVTKPESGTG